jgi:hypothetical protein
MPLGAMKRLACYSDVWTTFNGSDYGSKKEKEVFIEKDSG